MMLTMNSRWALQVTVFAALLPIWFVSNAFGQGGAHFEETYTLDYSTPMNPHTRFTGDPQKVTVSLSEGSGSAHDSSREFILTVSCEDYQNGAMHPRPFFKYEPKVQIITNDKTVSLRRLPQKSAYLVFRNEGMRVARPASEEWVVTTKVVGLMFMTLADLLVMEELMNLVTIGGYLYELQDLTDQKMSPEAALRFDQKYDTFTIPLGKFYGGLGEWTLTTETLWQYTIEVELDEPLQPGDLTLVVSNIVLDKSYKTHSGWWSMEKPVVAMDVGALEHRRTVPPERDHRQSPLEWCLAWNRAIESSDFGRFRSLIHDQLFHEHPGGNDSDYGVVSVGSIEVESHVRTLWKRRGELLLPRNVLVSDGRGVCGNPWDNGEWPCGVNLDADFSEYCKVRKEEWFGSSLSLGRTSAGWKLYEMYNVY